MTRSNSSSPFDPKNYYPREPLSRGFRGRVRAGKLAIRAFGELIRTTPALVVQLGLLALTFLLGWWRGFGELDYLLVVIIFGVGAYAEAVNTTQERMADLLMLLIFRESGGEPGLSEGEVTHARGHVLIRVIKDYAAGTVTPVFLMAAIALITLLIRPL